MKIKSRKQLLLKRQVRIFRYNKKRNKMNKDMTIKTTKIAAGYYTFQYKGQNIEITKMEMPHENRCNLYA
jgi:ethanolamine utilization protein EutA (predicted chaperonin)